MTRRILVTSALPYANGHIHLGHLVEYLQTDMWVRFQRLRGNHATYLCADDTHGTAIMIAARKAGQPESVLLAEMSAAHQRDFADFGIRFDHYGSTNAPSNYALVKDIWAKLRAGGHVDEKVVEQLYDPQAGAFLADRFVKGTCPKCGAPDQYGDACDKCGTTYEATELKIPRSTLSGAMPELRSATHCFVKLEDFRALISAWVERAGSLHPDMAKWVRNTFLIDGEPLRAWDVSRPAAYFGFEIPDLPGNYFYVWLDAPFGYISATVDWCDQVGAEKSGGDWRSWWHGNDTEIHHFIGKDIAKFHTLFWPAMLKLGGYNLPTAVHIHGFLTVNGEKMSKSKGTFINARTWLDCIGNPAYLRYYYAAKLGANADDLDLNLEELVAKVNSDLVGKVVNLASRTARFVESVGLHPDRAAVAREVASAWGAEDADALASAYERGDFNAACRLIMAHADRANEYVAARAPWALAKDPAKAGEVQLVCTSALTCFWRIAVALSPVLPQLFADACRLLKRDPAVVAWKDIDAVLANASVAPFTPLMDRLDPVKVAAMVEASKAEAAPADAPSTAVDDGAAPDDGAALAAEPIAAPIAFDDFAKLDLRVARVLTAEEVPKAKKILKLTVSLGGDERRTIFAGIKTAYAEPEKLVGRLIVVVANLAPKAMSFGTSEGMVIAAGPGGSDIFVLSPDRGAKPGQRIH